MTLLYLVRHGQTEWSKSGQHTSITDLDLTDAGVAQAESLHSRLDPAEFGLVLSSPRLRARRTAELAGFTDYEIEEDLDAIEDFILDEDDEDDWDEDYEDYEDDEDYYDPDPAAPDKTYAKRGAFLDKVDFDALGWGVPPSTIPATDTSQLLALVVAQKVLQDALREQFETADRSRVSVILGVTSAQELLSSMVSRLQRPVWVKSPWRCSSVGTV